MWQLQTLSVDSLRAFLIEEVVKVPRAKQQHDGYDHDNSKALTRVPFEQFGFGFFSGFISDFRHISDNLGATYPPSLEEEVTRYQRTND